MSLINGSSLSRAQSLSAARSIRSNIHLNSQLNTPLNSHLNTYLSDDLVVAPLSLKQENTADTTNTTSSINVTNPTTNPTSHNLFAQKMVRQTSHFPTIESTISTAHSTAQIASSPVLPTPRTFLYPNGLTLIVEEDSNATKVGVAVYCAAGTRDEKVPGSELAHFLEHMLVEGTGTTSVKFDDLNSRLQRVGRMHGATAYDYTIYAMNVSPKDSSEAIALLSDIMINSELPPEHFDPVCKVVQQERSQRNSNIQVNSPWLYSLIGESGNSLSQVTYGEMREYYKQYYVPNNLTFVVVGNVHALSVRDQLAAYFKKYPAASSPSPRESRSEFSKNSSPIGTLVISERHPTSTGHVRFAWNFIWEIPSLEHSDRPVLEVLASLLKEHQELPDKSSVDIISMSDRSFNESEILVITTNSEPYQHQQARDSVFKLIQKIRAGEITEQELQNSKASLIFNKLKSFADVDVRTADLGVSWLRTRNPNFRNDHLKRIQAVCREDIIAVANRYFEIPTQNISNITNTNNTKKNPIDTSSSQKIIPLQPPSLSSRASNSENIVEITPAVASFQQPTPPLRSQVAVKEVRSFHMPNGLPVLLKVNRSLPLVVVQAAFRLGDSAEISHKSNAFSLFASTLLHGTTSQSAQQISDKIKSWGGELRVNYDQGIITVTIETTSSSVNPAIDLLTDLIKNANFPENEVESAKANPISGAIPEPPPENPFGRADAITRHRLGLCTQRSSETFPGNANDLRNLKKQLLVAKNGVIAVFGDIDIHQIRTKIWQNFKDLPSGDSTIASSLPDLPPLSSTVVVRQPSPNQNAVVMLGYRTPAPTDSDFPALQLLSYVLHRRIHQQIREKQGLAYTMEANIDLTPGPGALIVHAVTTPDTIEQIRTEFADEIHKLVTERLADEEFYTLQKGLLSEDSLEDGGDMSLLASQCASDTLRGLRYDHYLLKHSRLKGVKPEDLQRVAKKYLKAPHVETIINS